MDNGTYLMTTFQPNTTVKAVEPPVMLFKTMINCAIEKRAWLSLAHDSWRVETELNGSNES